MEEIIKQAKLSPDSCFVFFGEEPSPLLLRMRNDHMSYRMNSYHLKLEYIVGLIRGNTKIGILRLGNRIDPSVIFKYYQGLIEEGGLLIVDSERSLERFKPDFNQTVGKYSLVFEDTNLAIYKKDFTPTEIKFAIVMASYQRKNGNSPHFVRRSLKSISTQTYQNFKVFLIGDKYEDDEEFKSFSLLLPQDKLHLLNLSYALERENCKFPINLWAIGGANAMNQGLSLAKDQEFTHYLHLDDDDSWNCFHLRNVAQGYSQFPETDFVTTCGITMDGWLLPQINGLDYNNFECGFRKAFHSAWGFRLDRIPFRYNTLTHPEVPYLASDGDMLNRIGTGLYKTLAIPLLTCLHDYEATAGSQIDFESDLNYETKRSQMPIFFNLRTLLGPEEKKYSIIGNNPEQEALIKFHPFPSIRCSPDETPDLLFGEGQVNPGGYFVWTHPVAAPGKNYIRIMEQPLFVARRLQ